MDLERRYMVQVQGKIFYKCRRCGEVYYDTHTPQLVPSIAFAIGGFKEEEFHVDLVSVHSCKDGNIGVSDLIGGEFDKE